MVPFVVSGIHGNGCRRHGNPHRSGWVWFEKLTKMRTMVAARSTVGVANTLSQIVVSLASHKLRQGSRQAQEKETERVDKNSGQEEERERGRKERSQLSTTQQSPVTSSISTKRLAERG